MPHRQPAEIAVCAPPTVDAAHDWRVALPMLSGSLVSLRELSLADAPALFAALTSAEVTRFISPPAGDVAGFERFIASMRRMRAAGECACFSIVPRGSIQPVGLFQVRSLGPGFDNAEWGFAMGSAWWGSGMFVDGARLAADFAFETIGVKRLEARAATGNGRGNGALRKTGAAFEATLRRSFLRHGVYHDQALWTILRDEWLGAKAVWGPRVILH